ncbi:hypothetical protein CHT98_10005 [Azospirillum brasilense]|uniref:Uncharacterized protein n=1 Tax=Azospirillum brasilense TaxID=192 RepID=A0A235HG21_AZOBR|nr:hypothetical protein CHT98_10005 [Azospirillum brasilense]
MVRRKRGEGQGEGDARLPDVSPCATPSPALSGCQRHPPAVVSAGLWPAREALRATLSPGGRGLRRRASL